MKRLFNFCIAILTILSFMFLFFAIYEAKWINIIVVCIFIGLFFLLRDSSKRKILIDKILKYYRDGFFKSIEKFINEYIDSIRRKRLIEQFFKYHQYGTSKSIVSYMNTQTTSVCLRSDIEQKDDINKAEVYLNNLKNKRKIIECNGIYYNPVFYSIIIKLNGYLKENAMFSTDDLCRYTSNLLGKVESNIISESVNFILNSDAVENIDKDVWISKVVSKENDNVERELIILD